MQRCMGCMEVTNLDQEICPQCGYQRGTPPREAYHMPPESILAARYIVGRVLGFGGFGVTYIGWDAQLERKVAVKEFLPSTFATRMPGYTEITVYGGEATLQFEAGLSRFTDEAKRLAAFNSIPGIVDIYNTFVENNTAYIVMQFLQGEDVKHLLAEKGSFTFEEALPIVVSVCETLEPVHAEGIIHRDIAPDNIYITKEGEIKLLDFGASRFATSVNSKSLSVILKSGYAPEEQYRSKGEQGSWSDVYALSATLYKMLTGVTPMDSMERAIQDELKEPSQLGAVLPKDAENAIMNALNIRRENRIQTMGEFRKALTGDRVERRKEKAVRSDSGALPLWGRLLIAGSLTLFALFGLLTVTGVLDFGQGNLLADTFGSGIPEGYLNTPGVVNQMEGSARKAVQKAGLTYLIAGTAYSDTVEEGNLIWIYTTKWGNRLRVSAGPETEKEMTIRAPLITRLNGRELSIQCALARALDSYGESTSNVRLMLSADGTNWEEADSRNTKNGNDKEQVVQKLSFYVPDTFFRSHLNWADRDLFVELELTDESGRVIESMGMNEKLRFSFRLNAP